MVKNPELLRRLEDELCRLEPIDVMRNFRIYEELYNEAVLLGVLPRPDPLDGIEHCIRLTRALNSVP